MPQRQSADRIVREVSIVDVLDEVLGRGIVVQHVDRADRADETRSGSEVSVSVVDERPPRRR